jgi:hypothetical protein
MVGHHRTSKQANFLAQAYAPKEKQRPLSVAVAASGVALPRSAAFFRSVFWTHSPTTTRHHNNYGKDSKGRKHTPHLTQLDN